MPTHNDLPRLHHLLSLFFGDEGLHFHSTRMNDFITAAFAEHDDEYQPNIPRLLHTQNDLLRLLDAAYLLQHNPIPPLLVPEEKVFDHIKRIRAVLEDWEDFPSYLRTNEWFRPEGVLEEFFAMQSIDGWKDAVQALLESAIGEGSPLERLSEIQSGFVVIMMH